MDPDHKCVIYVLALVILFFIAALGASVTEQYVNKCVRQQQETE